MGSTSQDGVGDDGGNRGNVDDYTKARLTTKQEYTDSHAHSYNLSWGRTLGVARGHYCTAALKFEAVNAT